MTDEQIENLVTRIIQRLQPPALVIVTPEEDYRHAIRERLAGCGQHFHFALAENTPDAAQWQSLGKTLPANNWQERFPQTPYRALLLPFLDYALAADLANGTLGTPVARRVHDALLRGIPVMALRYHCDPTSELNQLRGVVTPSPYAQHLQTVLSKLESCGVALCTMNELLAKLGPDGEMNAPVKVSRRYVTVSDIINNPQLAQAANAELTDAAIDFLKNKKHPSLINK